MADLIEGTYATGAGVFHPGHDFTPESEPSDDSRSTESKENIDPALQQSMTAAALPPTTTTVSEPPVAATTAPQPLSSDTMAAHDHPSQSSAVKPC